MSRELSVHRPEVGIVLGSGLGGFSARCGRVAVEVPFPDAGVPGVSVAGHNGRFLLCELAGRPILLMLGRIHLYEGHPAAAVAAGVRWMAAQGIRTLVLTNAAGCLNPAFGPGGWMMLTDHLNLTGTTPLLGGPHFVDMGEVYSSRLRGQFQQAAIGCGLTLHEGIYAGVPGPQYETPAEVRMLRGLGADAVGMSTVLEAIQARALGLDVAGFSCLTNWGAGIAPGPLDHADVIETGRRAVDALADLMAAWLAGRKVA